MAVFWASILTAILSVCAVIAVIKLLVIPQMGSRSAVALCTISHVYTSHNCVHVTVGYMTTDGTQARGYILPHSRKQDDSTSKVGNCSHEGQNCKGVVFDAAKTLMSLLETICLNMYYLLETLLLVIILHFANRI